MPIANPLTGSGSGAPTAGPAPAADTLYAAEPLHAGGEVRGGGFGLAVGSDFSHPDNTNAHVALLVAAALVVIVVFHIGGFRFAVDAGVAAR